MKYLLPILAFCLFTININAQRVIEEEVTFSYNRLPLQPLEGVTGYTFTVDTPYPENNDDIITFAKEKHQRDVENFDQTIADAEADHQEALAQYDNDIEIARENFKLESEEFKSLSLVERLALSDQKPKLKLPRKPVYRKPSEPRYQEPNLSNSIVFNPQVLADTYLKLEGYEKSDAEDDVLVGKIVFFDFEYLEPEAKVEEKSYYDTKTKSTRKKTERYYITSFKRPTQMTLTYNGEVVYDDFLEGTGDFVEKRTNSRPAMINLEKKSIEENILEANNFINSNYGVTPINTTVEVRSVKNKDGEYDDLEEAKDFAVSGYQNFDAAGSNDDLEEAISIWETALEESNLEDRKARIDKKVTEAILFNLVEATLYTQSLDQTKMYLKKLGNMKLSYSEKQTFEGLEGLMLDRKTRLEAN